MWFGFLSLLRYVSLDLPHIFNFPDMRTFELMMALAIIPYLSYALILPESPRWLLSKGRNEEARVVFKKALKFNKKPLTLLSHLERKVEPKPQKVAFVTDLLAYPNVRRNLICLAFCWFCVSMGSFGLNYNTPSFGCGGLPSLYPRSPQRQVHPQLARHGVRLDRQRQH